MLFSSSEVAGFVNANFEPAWESVRPAPLVTIDFGNGHVVRRTLQGNVATYVCAADGTVYDVLPGIYAPDVYREQLAALKALAGSLGPLAAEEPRSLLGRVYAARVLVGRLREYHKLRESQLAAPAAQAVTPQMQSVARTGGGFKGGFGGGIGGIQAGFQGGFGGQPQPVPAQLQALAKTGGGFKGGAFPPAGFGGNAAGAGFGGFQTPAFSGIEGPLAAVITGAPLSTTVPATPAGPLAARPELKLDSEVNERIRRRAVHAELARLGFTRPNDIKAWLFREVLHADLEDPKLGLGAILDADYPFAEEDRAPGAQAGK